MLLADAEIPEDGVEEVDVIVDPVDELEGVESLPTTWAFGPTGC